VTRPAIRQFLACVALAALGCSPAATEGVLTGAVTLDGAPVNSGQIRFVPVDGQSPTAGAVITAGRYETKLAPAEYSVEISSPKEGPTRSMYDASPEPTPSDAGAETIPARYNAKTELKLKVEAGDAERNFELTSK
jgi:hypothetical protein